MKKRKSDGTEGTAGPVRGGLEIGPGIDGGPGTKEPGAVPELKNKQEEVAGRRYFTKTERRDRGESR